MPPISELQEAINACERTRAKLGNEISFRARTLLDMLLLELGKELSTALGNGLPLHSDAERDR